MRALYNCMYYFENLEVFIKPTDEASTASTPRPRPLRHRSSASAVHLAVKKGECEHSKLLASGMVLFAMNPRLSARYENTNEKDEEFPMEDTAQLTVPWCVRVMGVLRDRFCGLSAGWLSLHGDQYFDNYYFWASESAVPCSMALPFRRRKNQMNHPWTQIPTRPQPLRLRLR